MKKLGEAFSIFNGYAFSSNASVDNGNLWVKIADVGIQEMKRDNISFLPFDFKEKYSKFILEKGDYVVALTRPILSGKLKIAKIDDFFNGSLLNQRVGKIQTNNHNGFIYYTLQRTPLIKEIENNIAGSDPPNLSPNEINLISIKLPVISEQQKIADFLEIIDTRIQTQRKIISQLKSQMSNLKDLIFEQQLRFKNDKENEFPDWKGSKLEDICEKKSSNISANKIEDNVGNYPIYGATGILKSIDFYEVENDYVSIIKDGAGVGRLIYCKGKSSVLGTLDIIQSKNVNLYFIFLLLSRIDFKKYITGSTIPHIYFKDYKKENFQIPSIKEQEKIANFFKLLDDKINTESSLLIQYENQKKYLLQNLFV
ncbi:restriction endonuclease subunit S [Elizabethkingia meningoseptica]|uniref:restriction endonuclease subunit S n=1 Tax=Elizabethkingia meningoseptica TaxID=238 RepID=UPI003019BB1D